jgi:hypothetical protein
MPNHCYQSVYLHGPTHLVSMLYDGLTQNGYNPHNEGRALNPQLCQLVCPMPFEVWANEERRSDQLMPDWYEWRVENWGTKWDVCEAEIDEDGLEYSDDKKVAWFSFRCWTAWAPPVPVWDRLHAMGIEVEADFEDEGEMFAGAYRDGEESNWTYVDKDEAV